MTRYGLAFWRDICKYSSPFKLNFQLYNTRNFIKFTDIQQFKNQMYNLIQSTTIINDVRCGVLNELDRREYDSVKKIKNYCEKNNMKFEYNYTDAGPIDFYINGHPCQTKCIGYMKYNLYECALLKRVKSESVPYEDTDGIEYFIFQVQDQNNILAYQNDFLIIPTQILIDRGYIKTEIQDGRMKLLIPPPDYNQYNWLESFWNNWLVVQNNSQCTLDPIFNFANKYKCIFKNARKVYNGNYRITARKSYLKESFEYFIIFLYDGDIRLYTDYIFLISKNDLIGMNLILESNKESIFYIKSPDYKEIHWSKPYWKKSIDLEKL